MAFTNESTIAEVRALFCTSAMHADSQRHHNMNAMPLQRSREDRTAIELFLAGVQGWEWGLRRQFDGGKPKPD